MNGWNTAVKLSLRPRVGVVADFGGNYGERRMTPTQFQALETKPGDYRQHTILFGPEIRVLEHNRLNVNLRALIGAAYIGTLVLPLQQPFQPPPPLVGPPQPVQAAADPARHGLLPANSKFRDRFTVSS